MPQKKKRSRAAEARRVGKVMQAYELTEEAAGLIATTAEHLARTGDTGRCSKIQALEKIIRAGSRQLLEQAG